MPPSDLESRLRARFGVRTETFEHGPLSLEILLPDAAEELIDEAEFDVDERLPYWADLWPSARALARRLAAEPAPGGRVLELGSGVGLPSLALLWRGADVLATDWYADALLFARANAERNGLPELAPWRWTGARCRKRWGASSAWSPRTCCTRWERREPVARAAAAGGARRRAVVADPGRVYRSEFVARMAWRGWTVEEARVREPTDYAPAGSQEIHLLTLRPPPD